MQVPLLDLKAQTAALREDIDAAIARVLDSGKFILGDEVPAFEEEIGAWLGAHAVGVASGTDALWLALRLADVGPGDLVLTSPFTFFATVSSICATGATPVFADIDAGTFNLDPSRVRAVLDGDHPVFERGDLDPKAVKAIVPVHLYGQAAQLDVFRSLASERGLRLLEDAAQAIGATYRGEKVGKRGVASWSFFPSKNLGAFGDGGLVTCESEEDAERVRVLRAHGMKPRYFHRVLGTNSRLDALQAAILRVKLPHLASWTAKRQANAAAYTDAFGGIDGISPPPLADGCEHAYHQYTVRIHDGRRDAVVASLKAKGIGNAIYYQVCCHLQEAMAGTGWSPGDFPVAEQASSEVLSLPVFPELTEAQRDAVIAAVREALA